MRLLCSHFESSKADPVHSREACWPDKPLTPSDVSCMTSGRKKPLLRAFAASGPRRKYFRSNLQILRKKFGERARCQTGCELELRNFDRMHVAKYSYRQQLLLYSCFHSIPDSNQIWILRVYYGSRYAIFQFRSSASTILHKPPTHF